MFLCFWWLHFKQLWNYLLDSYILLSFSGLKCQVAIEVEREEDEGGTVGETFTDYVSVFLLRFMFDNLVSGISFAFINCFIP